MDLMTYAIVANKASGGAGGVAFDSIQEVIRQEMVRKEFTLEESSSWSDSLTPAKKTLALRKIISEMVTQGYNCLVFPKNKEIEIELNSETGAESVDYAGTALTLPSNFTLDLNGGTLKLKPNEYTARKYELIRTNGDYVGVCNGTLQGDYATPSATKQWGVLLDIENSYGEFKNLVLKDCVGDGISMDEHRDQWSRLKLDSLESSIYNKTRVGLPIINLNDYSNFKYTRLIFHNSQCGRYLRTFRLDIMSSDAEDASVLATRYYEIGENIKVAEILPISSYVKISFNVDNISAENVSKFMSSASYAYFRFTNQLCSFNKVENVIINHIGRNGMTIACAFFNTFKNLKISDINGTAPMACIDIEEGREGCCYNEFYNLNLFDSKIGVAGSGGSHNMFYNSVFGEKMTRAVYAGTATDLRFRGCDFYGDVYFAVSGMYGMTIPSIFKENIFHAGSVVGRHALFDGNEFYNESVLVDKYSKVVNSEFYGECRLEGAFYHCIFESKKGTTNGFNVNNNTTHIPNEDSCNQLVDCTFNCAFFQTQSACELIGESKFNVNRMGAIKAKIIRNCDFDGMPRVTTGSAGERVFYDPSFTFNRMSGCTFKRAEDDSTSYPLNQYTKGMIVLDTPNGFTPTEMIIENCSFSGDIKATDSNPDTLLRLQYLKVPLYIFNNVKVGSGKNLNYYTINTTTTDNVDTSLIQVNNNYGFNSLEVTE